MAIAKSVPKPINNRFPTKATGTVHVAHTQHSRSMLAQAARVPRLANISTVHTMLGRSNRARGGGK